MQARSPALLKLGSRTGVPDRLAVVARVPAATYVRKILNTTYLADLQVKQATMFEPVANLKSAKLLGIEIPQSILVRAD